MMLRLSCDENREVLTETIGDEKLLGWNYIHNTASPLEGETTRALESTDFCL